MRKMSVGQSGVREMPRGHVVAAIKGQAQPEPTTFDQLASVIIRSTRNTAKWLRGAVCALRHNRLTG
jgi:hypothetical protein